MIETKNITIKEVEELLKKQAETFTKQIAEQKENMQGKIDAMVKKNKELTEELNNLKTNTAEENALLGEKIAKINPEEKKDLYNPYNSKILYSVFNEEAQITTVMTGDEVECIVGLAEHITKKLIAGEKEFTKHPYTVTLIKKTKKQEFER